MLTRLRTCTWTPSIRSWIVRAVCLALALATTLPPRPVHAFSVRTHRMLSARVLGKLVDPGDMSGINQEKLAGFWEWLTVVIAKDDGKPDDLDGWRFRQAYPNPTDFGPLAARELLGFNADPTRPLRALDSIDDLNGTNRLTTYVDGSAWPDLDGRNRDRILRAPDGVPARLADGRTVPFDPMILNMGEASGLSSQAHAHYQLGATQPSSDVRILQEQPWNFVLAVGWPGPVETYAAWMAQEHLDLATLTSFWGHVVHMTSAFEPMMVAWQAAGLHYVEDAAGPLHAVQVGSYALFKRAKLAYWSMAARSCGGYCGELRTFEQIGLRFLHNHHLMAEAWLEDQLDKAMAGSGAHPEIAKAWAELDKDDEELTVALGDKLRPYITGPKAIAPWEDGRGLATILVETEARLAARDGGALYEAALLAGAPTLTALDTDLPDDGGWYKGYLGDPSDPQVAAAIDTMARIQAKSLRRAATAVRIYYKALDEASAEAASRRLRRAALDHLEAAKKRREAYLKHPPPLPAAGGHRDAQFLAVESAVLLAGLLLLWLVLRWSSRRSA